MPLKFNMLHQKYLTLKKHFDLHFNYLKAGKGIKGQAAIIMKLTIY